VVIYDWKDVMTSFPGCCIQPSRLLDLFIHSLSASFGWSSSTSQLNTFFFSASLAAFDFAYNLSIRIIRPTAPEFKAAVLTACIPTPKQQGSHYRGAFFLIRFVSFLFIFGPTDCIGLLSHTRTSPLLYLFNLQTYPTLLLPCIVFLHICSDTSRIYTSLRYTPSITPRKRRRNGFCFLEGAN
jgi:hypothetical protein